MKRAYSQYLVFTVIYRFSNNAVSRILLIFFDLAYGTKSVSFLPYNRYPWWNAGPTRIGENKTVSKITKSIMAGLSQPRQAWPGWASSSRISILWQKRNIFFLFYTTYRKNPKLLRYCVICNPVHNCKNELSTASWFLLALCCSQASHRRAKSVIVMNSKL